MSVLAHTLGLVFFVAMLAVALHGLRPERSPQRQPAAATRRARRPFPRSLPERRMLSRAAVL